MTAPLDLEHLGKKLVHVRRPGRYTGGEWNAPVRDWEAAGLRVALGFPDAYELGMSCLGYLIVYDLINKIPGCLAERFFSPMPDMEDLLRQEGLPLFTLESRRPVSAFDVVAFSFQYEILGTNILNALDLGGLALRSAERSESDPLVIAGGPASMAPEPMAPFIDLFLPGDGEEVLPGFLKTLSDLKASSAGRQEKIRTLAKLPGVYAPSLYAPAPDGSIQTLEDGLPSRVRAGVCPDLDAAPYPEAPPVPLVEAAHERIVLEIMRGCPNFCRFCQAGYSRRPPRYRSVDRLVELALRTYQNTGYSSMSLASLSSADYPELPRLIDRLTEEFDGKRVSISLPSLRIDEELEHLPAKLSTIRKSGLTLAPEAGCPELRSRINKDVRDEHLLSVARKAWAEGWRVVKLYFMIGLPGETAEDRKAIIELAHEISGLRRETGSGPGRVNVTISNFVPRPHTPLQWCAMETVENLLAFQMELKKAVKMRSVKLKFHDPRRNLVETVLARGGRSVARAVEEAWRAGARFDAWDDHFDADRYDEAFRSAGVDALAVAGARREDEPLPWEIIDTGVSRSFLWSEYRKSLTGDLTPSCEPGQCAGCGLSSKDCGLARSPRTEKP